MLTQSEYVGTGLPFLPIYTGCWALLFFILSLVAFVFIPIFFKHHQSDNIIQPQRTISLQRYLLGSFGFFGVVVTSIIVVEQNDNRHLSVTARIFFFSMDLLLAYHLTEREARHAAKKHLFYLLRIEESGRVGGGPVSIANSEIFQLSPMTDSVLFTVSARRKVSKCVSVSPVKLDSVDD